MKISMSTKPFAILEIIILIIIIILYPINQNVITAKNMSKTIFDPGDILWWYDLNAPSLGSAATADIDNDNKLEIVFGTYFNDENIYALNAENGTLLWSFDTGGCNDASPVIGDVDQDGILEVIVPASSPYTVYCLNGYNGSIEWETSTGYPNCIDSPPAIADVDNDDKPEVILGAWYGNVFCLNGENGSIQWQINLGSDSYIQSGPNILDLDNNGQLDIVIAQYDGDCRVYAILGNNGTTLWYSDIPQDFMYHGGSFADIDEDGKPEIAIGSYDKHVYVFNGENGSLLWDYQAPYYIAAPTSISDLNNDNHLEVVFASYNFIGVLNNTGGLIWSYPTGGSIFRGVSISDTNQDGIPDVIFGSDDGILRVLRGDNGQEIWTIDLETHYGNTYNIDHAPIIADFDEDGFLDIFVIGGYATSSNPGSNHGRAYALKGGNGTGPGWEMFRHDCRHSALFTLNQQNPMIENIKIKPNIQLSGGYVNISCVVNSSYSINVVKANITDPLGISSNISMNQINSSEKYYLNKTYNESGTYDVYIWTQDTTGNTNISTFYNFDIINHQLITTLQSNWNLLSHPFNLTMSLNNLIINYNSSNLSWSDAVAQNYINDNIFGWQRTTQTYYFASIFKPGFGYWLYSYLDNIELWASNITINYDNYITEIKTGWNLFCIPNNKNVTKADILINDTDWNTAVISGVISNYVFGWDRGFQNYNFADTLYPGFAYWIYAYQPSNLKMII